MNYPLPPEPAANEPLRASWGAQLIRWARANTLLPTPGMLLSRTTNGTSFRPQAMPSASAAAAAPLAPWQADLSPWTGTGTDPLTAAQRAVAYRLQRGKFAGATPTNMSDEFQAFGDITDTGIEEDDAVYTQVYLTVPVSESSLGSGDVTYAQGTINSIEGGDLVTAVNGTGAPIPDFGSNGSLPAYIVVPIGEIANWGGALHFLPGTSTYLDAILSVTGTSATGQQTRDFAIVGIVSTQYVTITEGGGG
jgi:hypothetical protein